MTPQVLARIIKSEVQEYLHEQKKALREGLEVAGSITDPVVSDLYESPNGFTLSRNLRRDVNLCDCPNGPGYEGCIHMYHGKFLAPVRIA